MRYILEVGVEELPVSFLAQGRSSMHAAAETLLEEYRLTGKVTTEGTARRLALSIDELPEAQPDRDEVVHGPPWSVAFKDGAFTGAAKGFAKKNGVATENLVAVETDKGKYVSVRVHEQGKHTREVIGLVAEGICKRISFPKTMRWGEGEHGFGRPVQWIVSVLDDDIIPFSFLGVSAGRQSRGHRFLSPDHFEVTQAAQYAELLEARHVVVSVDTRKKRMNSALTEAAQSFDAVVVQDVFLENECASLVEEAFVVPGTFESEFLQLPDEVVISVMRDHQRYFALRDKQGKLLPRYLNVVNTAQAKDTIAKGNDRVLKARLADAAFFINEDKKKKLIERREKLNKVVFQHKLGSIGDKVERIKTLALQFADSYGVNKDQVAQAADLMKCDLESLIVFEFPELQGKMGRFYAEGEGVASEVAAAIETHYYPVSSDAELPPTALSTLLAVADRIDTLTGCFAIGEIPKGNKDPFALRRVSIAILNMGVGAVADVRLTDWIHAGMGVHSVHVKDKDKTLALIQEFFSARLSALASLWTEGSNAKEVLNAVLPAWDFQSVSDLKERVAQVAAFQSDSTDAFESLAFAFKRAHNITKDVTDTNVDSSLLTEGPERALAHAYEACRERVLDATKARDYKTALKHIAESLRTPIDTYFDDVMVMDENLDLRRNRLALLKQITETVNEIVHFHQLST